jgi:predicted ester cyclase
MSEKNKALVRRYYEIATGDLKGFENILSADFIDHHFPPGLPRGPEGARQFFTKVLGSIFSNMQIEHYDMVAEGDKVYNYFALRAKHTGEFAGNKGTGKTILCPAVSWFRVADGKLAEAWEIADVYGLVQQMQAK